MSAALEELLGKIRAAALVRGEDWLRQKVAEILEDEEKVPGTQDPSPRAKRIRPQKRRRLSAVPRTQRTVRYPVMDPPGAANGQCPASEALRPATNPFSFHSSCEDEERRTLYAWPSTCAASTAVTDISSMEDHWGLHCYNTLDDSHVSGASRGWTQQNYNSSGNVENIPIDSPSGNTTESIELRIERILQACSAASSSQDQHAPSAAVQDGIAAEPTDKDLEPCSVWILGNSYVTLAMEKASLQPDGCQLGFPRSKAIIRWVGIDGLTWECVRPTVERDSRLDRPPDILVLHAGGNDIGVIPMTDLQDRIKSDLLKLKSLFPKIVFVWSEIVYRQKWFKSKKQKGLQNSQFGVNRYVARFLRRNGIVVRHKHLEGDSGHLFEEDGNHLNSLGNDIWCLGIHKGIDRALRIWHKHSTG